MQRREFIQAMLSVVGSAISAEAVLKFSEDFVNTGTKAHDSSTSFASALFNEQQRALLAAMCNAILPKSKTLSATQAGADAFVIYGAAHLLDAKAQDEFLKGLRLFGQLNKGFASMPEHAQSTIIEALDAQAFQHTDQVSSALTSFYKQLKTYCLIGYFSSEAVMTQQLDYHAIPGRFEGDVPLRPETKLFVSNNAS